MDPTAVCNMVTALAEMVTEIARGQSVAQRQQLWEWFISDQKAWREFFKFPPPKP